MLTKTDIWGYANMTTYNKGLELYRRDRVTKFSVEEDDGEHILHATVKGSGRNLSISSICKHCVAVLLEYLDWGNRIGRARYLSMRSGRRRAWCGCRG